MVLLFQYIYLLFYFFLLSEVTNIISDKLFKHCWFSSSNSFYSNIPGFKLTYGGTSSDSFTTYHIGKYNNVIFLNLELRKLSDNISSEYNNINNFGRIIFYTDDVDRLYTYIYL